MNTLEAAMMNAMTPDGHGKVFDWDKAATILKEKNPEVAMAGLEGDFEWTGGCIWKDGKPVLDDYTYLASRWATPILIVDEEEIPCYLPKGSCEWTADTKWPESALKIIEGGN